MNGTFNCCKNNILWTRFINRNGVGNDSHKSYLRDDDDDDDDSNSNNSNNNSNNK